MLLAGAGALSIHFNNGVDFAIAFILRYLEGDRDCKIFPYASRINTDINYIAALDARRLSALSVLPLLGQNQRQRYRPKTQI